MQNDEYMNFIHLNVRMKKALHFLVLEDLNYEVRVYCKLKSVSVPDEIVFRFLAF